MACRAYIKSQRPCAGGHPVQSSATRSPGCAGPVEYRSHQPSGPNAECACAAAGPHLQDHRHQLHTGQPGLPMCMRAQFRLTITSLLLLPQCQPLTGSRRSMGNPSCNQWLSCPLPFRFRTVQILAVIKSNNSIELCLHMPGTVRLCIPAHLLWREAVCFRHAGLPQHCRRHDHDNSG